MLRDHVVPFQTSAKTATVGLWGSALPTAMQKVGDVHETPVRMEAEPGAGTGETFQEPFQTSANAALLPVSPTAMQNLALAGGGQDTPFSWPPSVLTGVVIGCHGVPVNEAAPAGVGRPTTNVVATITSAPTAPAPRVRRLKALRISSSLVPLT
jgi:hypothetical protein